MELSLLCQFGTDWVLLHAESDIGGSKRVINLWNLFQSLSLSFREFAKERKRVEKRQKFIKIRQHQAMQEDLDGYLDWIETYGTLSQFITRLFNLCRRSTSKGGEHHRQSEEKDLTRYYIL